MHYFDGLLDPVVKALKNHFKEGQITGITHIGRRSNQMVRYPLGDDVEPVTLINNDYPVVAYFGLNPGRFGTIDGRGKGRRNSYRVEQRVTLYVSTIYPTVHDHLIDLLSEFGGLIMLQENNFDAAAIVRAETGGIEYEWNRHIFTLSFLLVANY